jgi:hypothetical protein
VTDRTGILGIAALAILLRLFLLAVGLLFIFPDTQTFLSVSDAGSYVEAAQRLFGGAESYPVMPDYHARVFLGWPLAFGWGTLFGAGAMMAMGLTTIMAGVVPYLFSALGAQSREVLPLVYFSPAWVLYSVYPVAEGFFLVLCLGALLAAVKKEFVLAGVLCGAAIATKPFGVAVAAAALVICIENRTISSSVDSALRFSAGLAVPLIALLVGNWIIYGTPLVQLMVYGRDLASLNVTQEAAQALGDPAGHWGWPFQWLILTPLRDSVPAWKVAYIGAHVVGLVAVAIVAIRRLRTSRGIDRGMAIWVLLCGLLVLCTGPYWAFHSFDRYVVWLLPAALWLIKEPIRKIPMWLHGIVGSGCVAMVVLAILRHAP